MKLTCYHSCLWAALILRLLSSPTLVDTKNVVWPEGKTAALVESGHSQELSTVTLEALEGLFTENVLGKRELVVGYGEECRNVHRATDKCAFTRKYCTDEDVGLFNYLELYYCTFPRAPALALTIMVVWLGTLFTTLGIAASDFFCINLSTISSVLGMSESMAGVTFLAFGNGSPDVFSTFAAMKINSGSLAVGELIGAASFIVAVVAGSMAIVRPFKVARRPFLRDVTFFVFAILFGVVVLADGEIHMWECIVMVLYYISYVLFVCIWHWWSTRSKKHKWTEIHARDQYAAPGEEEARNLLGSDEDSEVGSSEGDGLMALAPDIRLLGSHAHTCCDNDGSGDGGNDDEEEDQLVYAELSNNMRVTRSRSDAGMLSATTPHSIRPSLVGALEFRSVLSSLRKSQNLRGRPIHLCKYSDNPVPQRSSAPGTLMNNTPIGSFRESSMILPYSDSSDERPEPWPPRPALQRARAVTVNDPGSLVYSDHGTGTSLTPPTNHPLLNGRRETGLTIRLPSPNLLAPPGGPVPDTTVSSPASIISQSTHLSPTNQGESMDGGSLRFLESPIIITEDNAVPPSISLPLPHASTVDGDMLREHLLNDSNSSQTPPGETNQTQSRPHNLSNGSLRVVQLMAAKLFPTMQGFGDKSLWGKLMALMALPSVFLLAITLPVVEDIESHKDSEFKQCTPDVTPPLLIEPGSPQSPPAAMHSPVQPSTTEQGDAGDWNRWLHSVQCIFAPVFVAFVLFSDSPSLKRLLLCALLIGLISLFLLRTFTLPNRRPKYHHLLCYVGFIVSISWISTIANEVVGVLKTIGVIFNISDAILGLTIFAVGNSLGDLVADITIAKLGYPVMALSACFGGPMMNILLGVGISGIYLAMMRDGKIYRVQVSSTLVISAVTLLVTLVFLLVAVPLNRWRMSKRIGWTMVTLWCISTIVSLCVEVVR